MDKVWLKSFKQFAIEPEITLPSENSSLIDLFENNVKKYAHLPAFVCMNKKMTFAELDAYSLSFAGYLQSLNLEKGSRVAIMMPNLFQYAIAILAVLRAGLILVNVNPLYTTRELEYQLNDSGSEVLITVDQFAHVFQPIQNKTTVKHIIITGIGDMLGLMKGSLVNFILRYVRKEVPDWSLNDYIAFEDALAYPANHYQRPIVSLSDTAVLQYTGGTTGVSKGAELSHSNLIANVLQIDKVCESKFGQGATLEGEYFVCALPLYHIFAFTACALYGMSKGAANILIPNPKDLPAVIREFHKYKPSVFPAVNTLFNALVNHEDFKLLDHSRLKICIGGGMAVLSSTAEAWKKITGVTIIEGYGLSETSPVVAVNAPCNPDFTGTIGLPVPSTDIAIIDANGNYISAGSVDEYGEPIVGEIAIRGPQVMKGYWNRDDETVKMMTSDGFFLSGDIGFMNADGFVKIVDRKKDMILVSGFNVYPNEVEDVIAKHPKVLEIAVISVPDEKSGEVPKAFIVKKDESLTTEEILAFAKENLAGYKCPRYVEFLNELPKSNVGKILRKDLKK